MPATFLTARWENLIMANYEVSPDLLIPYLPSQTELDLWQGRCYVSLVGFGFQDTRVRGWRIPFHTHFPEVNLRFYVRHLHQGEWRRGVVFIKELVPKPAITWVANTLYHENYQTVPMRYQWERDEESIRAAYQWKYKGRWNELSATADAHPVEIPVGSEQEFISEHYWGYTKLNGHSTSEYQVEHPRWLIFPIRDYRIDCEGALLYGPEFGYLLTQPPTSVFLAQGSEIIVRKGIQIAPE